MGPTASAPDGAPVLAGLERTSAAGQTGPEGPVGVLSRPRRWGVMPRISKGACTRPTASVTRKKRIPRVPPLTWRTLDPCEAVRQPRYGRSPAAKPPLDLGAGRRRSPKPLGHGHLALACRGELHAAKRARAALALPRAIAYLSSGALSSPGLRDSVWGGRLAGHLVAIERQRWRSVTRRAARRAEREALDGRRAGAMCRCVRAGARAYFGPRPGLAAGRRHDG
jgi:hypothetical protein